MPLTATFIGVGPSDPARPLLEAAANKAYTGFLNGYAAGRTFVSVLIRGDAHSTTGAPPNMQPDARHATMNFRSEVMAATGRHMPAHVYLAAPASYQVTSVTWFPENRD
ncbi:hypothetical protein Q9L58_006880 [Maublancomyces gigas]|uniref:Uncharacterized protein n=1 Tax=Discina gigas TaxID=1032678 RepID=A0ABR3GE51_9PEZI